jgi:ribonuclease G
VIDNIASKLNSKTQKEIFVHVHPFIEAYITKGFFKSVKKDWQKRFNKKIVVVPRDAFTMLEWKLLDKENNPV